MIKIRREAKVGIFAFITMAALYWGINFLKGQDLFRRNNSYYAVYDQVYGIQESSPIVIKGYKVGVVSRIAFDPQRSNNIIMEFSIQSKYQIPENSKARIFSDGLLGGKAIEIELGDSPRYLYDQDTLRSELDLGFLEMAGSELEYIKQKASVLVNDLSKTLNGINNLLDDNSENIAATFNNIAQMTGSLNRVVNNEEASLRQIISNLNSLTAALSNNSGKIDNIIGNIEGFSDSLRRADIPAVVDNMAETVAQLNDLLEKAAEGEGSLGKLLSDDALYDSLVYASGSLARLLDDVKANPGRYVKISVFGGKNK